MAIHYRDVNKDFGRIETFTSYNELNSILEKVKKVDKTSLTSIIYNQNKFNLEELYKDYPYLKEVISGEGKERRMTSGCTTYDCFHDVKTSNDEVKILGIIKNKRFFRYIDKKYIELPNENIYKYKVIVPANGGSGELGEVLASPLIGGPLIGYTQTFIGMGAFDSEFEAQACLKYIKSKFARTMLGILKITQNRKRETWQLVPLQDFTEKSDIDWSQSVAQIDKQLYAKYNLTPQEISFIETHVKEMP